MPYDSLSQMWNLTMPSGDVWQKFGASFLSPQVMVNDAGNPTIERDVVGDVASFGRQLGILSEAVLELAGPAAQGQKVKALRDLVTKVNAVKQRRKDSAAEVARDALETLRNVSPEALSGLLAEFRVKAGGDKP